MYNILPFYETKTKAQIQAFFDKVHKEMEQKEVNEYGSITDTGESRRDQSKSI